MTEPRWITLLVGLLSGADSRTGDPLDAGAELNVAHADGEPAFSAGLARMHRLEHLHGELPTLWVRPIIMDLDAYVPTIALARCRRRGLTFTDMRVLSTEPAHLRMELWNGQVAELRPATGRNLAAVQAYDDLAYNALAPSLLAELEKLREDGLYVCN